MFEFIEKIANSRPQANHGIEQFLMTPASLLLQIEKTANLFKDKKILFLGDDDHFSIILANYVKTAKISVLEYDTRIISNQQALKVELNLLNHSIVEYDATNPLDKSILTYNDYDYFIVNPPYGSKNELYGSKVWISRCLEVLKVGGKGLVILPVDFKYQWSIENMKFLQQFLLDNNCAVYEIERNLHNYFDVNDKGLMSSNIWVTKLSESHNLINEIDKNLYR